MANVVQKIQSFNQRLITPLKSARRRGELSECDELGGLIGDIYDAALDPALWNDVLAEIARFIGGQASGMITKDMVNTSANKAFFHNSDSNYMAAMRRRFGTRSVGDFDVLSR